MSAKHLQRYVDEFSGRHGYARARHDHTNADQSLLEWSAKRLIYTGIWWPTKATLTLCNRPSPTLAELGETGYPSSFCIITDPVRSRMSITQRSPPPRFHCTSPRRQGQCSIRVGQPRQSWRYSPLLVASWPVADGSKRYDQLPI